MKKEISEENRILLFSLRREQVGKNRNKMKKSNEHFFQLYNEKGEVVGSLGDLLKRLEEARISVKEMSDEVAQESFNTVSNIYDQPTADEALPIFEGLQYLHICDLNIFSHLPFQISPLIFLCKSWSKCSVFIFQPSEHYLPHHWSESS